MLTKLYPMVQFKKDTWEIDEFDCASMFLLIGTEKAMLIDCGMGIGDLRGAVEMLTDKPLIVVITHGHIDHTANARQFDEIWIHPKDQDRPIPQSLERRRFDTERIAKRQKNCIGGAYTMFNLYPYDLNVDLREPGPDEKMPVIHDLYDGQQFDLGGGRIVTAYECPGHTAGEMVFLDEQTRSLFAGDALNFNLGVSDCPVETTLRYLKRLRDLGDKYDGIYNGHHDFRALGAPLDGDCLPTAIAILEDALDGHIVPCETPSFWGGDMPLTREPAKSYNEIAPAMNPGEKKRGKRITLRRGRNFLSIDPDKIRE
ncbi:MAG: MBL fold metallo-hydrolase [Candidatus Spyradocola sp.]|nr:MBL fold metallo-hydrolase [Candidatus Spyradocola sp.]